MNHQASAVNQLRRRLQTVLTMRYAVSAATIWCFCWGVAVLIGRVGWQLDRFDLAWGALGLVVAAVVGVVMAMSRVPDHARLHAVVDQQSRAGGLVMASAEADTSAWQDRVAKPNHLTVRWRGGRTWGLFVAGLAFVAISFLAPDRLVSLTAGGQLEIGDEVTQLQQQIETLVEERILESEEANELKDKLQQVQQEATGSDPAKTWEALDHMNKQLTDAAADAAEDNIAKAERLTQTEALATALDEGEQMLNPTALAEAMSELARRLSEDNPLGQHLDDETLDALQKMASDPQAQEALDELSEQMQQAGGGEPGLAKVDRQGQVTLYLPDSTLKPADVASGTGNRQALKGGDTTSVYTETPGKTIKLDLSKLNIDPLTEEVVFELTGDQSMRLYTPDDGATPNLSGLPAESVATMEIDGTAQQFVYDKEATEQMTGTEPLDPELLRKLAEAAKASKMDINQMMQSLANAKLIDAKMLKQCEGACQCDCDALLAFLAEEGGQCDSQALLAMCKPGSGGINRGRADAPLTWKDPSNAEGVEFLSEALPPASLNAIKDAQKIGVSVGTPELAGEDVATSSGALSGAKSGGGSANTTTVLPRHRAAVQQYFERE